jgi:hypothetical protein
VSFTFDQRWRFMSGAFLIATDKRSAEPKPEFFGLELSRAEKSLSKLAKELGVPPLSSFVSVDEEDQEMLAELARESGVDTSDWKPEPVKWFQPAEGLKTVKALITRLTEDEKAVKKQEQILRELSDLQHVLTGIGKKKAKWRFWIDT